MYNSMQISKTDGTNWFDTEVKAAYNFFYRQGIRIDHEPHTNVISIVSKGECSITVGIVKWFLEENTFIGRPHLSFDPGDRELVEFCK